jgi:tetratricopeptide (TPR) repeat protein
MSSIESLKEAARRHEQREEWQKALDLYARAIEKLDERESPDIGLFNRVGDLNTRIGRPEAAVEHYERAVDLYVESELPNNAIAVCKKIIRNLPGRYSAFLKMGRVRALQGFLGDARDNFLTYAERAQADGEIEEALRALGEFADLAPADTHVRMVIADRYLANGQPEDAVRQLALGYTLSMSSADAESAAAFQSRAEEIDPEADLASMDVQIGPPPPEPDVEEAVEADVVEFGPVAPIPVDEEIEADFGDIDLGGSDEDEPGFEALDADFGEIDLGGGGSGGEDDEDLPLVEFAGSGLDEEEDEEDEVLGGDLPLVTFDDEDDDETDDDFALGVEEWDSLDDPSDAEVAAESAVEEAAADLPQDPSEAFEELAARAADAPDDVSIPQRMVEAAYRMNDDGAMARAYLALAGALVRTDESAKAKSVFQQVLAIDPDNAEAISGLADVGGTSRRVQEVAASEDYVDLGALILDDDEEEKTTRFTVAYEEPTGDEDADFRKMLSQFKAKVAENFDASDVRAHHDLGTAYKEMGLLDEAIEEFQQALRASADHLPTYELLGQVFMDRGEPEAAVNTLKRALKKSDDVEDELVGIYYYLGRAHEELGKSAEAIEYYDKVFALDINFADVTERLRTLR